MLECVVRVFGTDKLDFQLDDVQWAEVFSQPGGLLGGLKCCRPALYVSFRFAIAVTWSGIVVWSLTNFAQDAPLGYWFIYLTHWGATFELIYFWFAAWTTLLATRSKPAEGKAVPRTPWFASVTWVLGSLVPVASFMVFALYWALVFKPGPGKPKAISVAMHGVNFALVFVDLVINRQPFYIAHVYVPLLFSALYALFTFIYFKAGGTDADGNPYIYKAIDWRSDGTGNLLALIVLVGVPVIYMAFPVIVALRVRARKTVVEESEV